MLEEFIVQAKSATYVGGGNKSATPTRKGSHDLGYQNGDWHYIDSYFGELISSVRRSSGIRGRPSGR